MAANLALLAVIGALLYFVGLLLRREEDLRRENERLLARIGWEYHIAMDRPQPQPGDIPTPVEQLTPASRFFRTKPDPRYLTPNPKRPE